MADGMERSHEGTEPTWAEANVFLDVQDDGKFGWVRSMSERSTHTIPVTWVRSDSLVDWPRLIADMAQRILRDNDALRARVGTLEADNQRLNAVIDELVERMRATNGG